VRAPRAGFSSSTRCPCNALGYLTMLLAVGGESEIARGTLAALHSLGRPVLSTTRHPERMNSETLMLDLSAPLDGWEPPAGIDAACIFAAVARLGACQSDPVASAHVNVTQTMALIERLLAAGIYVLHLSTNQVFDGRTPHVRPEAPTGPVSEYGRQKARCETAILEHLKRGAPVAILRLAKVFTPNAPLLREWAGALAQGRPIRPFHDMTLAPTPIDLVARAIAALLQDRAPGLFQLTGPHDVSYADMAFALAARIGADRRLVLPTSAASANLPVGATPPYTTLDSTRLAERYGIVAPDAFATLGIASGLA
jgi:dTDP-4-dehydrorhamnose reductase